MAKILRLENVHFGFSSVDRDEVDKLLYFNSNTGVLRVYILEQPCKVPFGISKSDLNSLLGGVIARDGLDIKELRIIHNQPIVNAYSSPFKIFLDITMECQLRCLFCLSEVRDGISAFLSISIIKKIAKEIKKLGVMYVKIGGGDPILHPNFLEILEILHSAGCFISMSTNSMIMTQKIADIFLKFNVKTSISIEGLEKTDDYLRTPGHFQKAITALEILKGAGVNVVLRTTLLRQNLGEVSGLIDLARNKGVKIKFSYCRPAGRAIHNRMLPGKEDAIEYLEAIRHINKPENLPCVLMDEGMMLNQPLDISKTLLRGRMCGAANRSMHIDAFGRISPCIFLGPTFSSGVIYEEGSIIDFWSGRMGNKFQAARYIRQPVECDDCERICNNECPANRFYFWGNFDKQDPNCLRFATRERQLLLDRKEKKK